jgi:hypothetical protein
MAVKKPSATSFVRGAAGTHAARQREDVASREAAPHILSPNDVLGNYDAARLLYTTLGGGIRPITTSDLEAFRRNAQTVGKRFRGGITPQGVIDHSRAEDRQRARQQIHYAVPARDKAGTIQFVTNAGPDSNVSRHFITVELVYFSAAVASPKKPGQMADYLTRGKVRFDCDCERHRYWFRYIATIGRYNAGRDETGFPKIRNPQLTGVACKHVLRVMVALREGQVRNYIAKMVERGQRSVVARTAAASTETVNAILKAQTKAKSPIATSAQKRAASKSTARLKALAKSTIEKHPAMNRTTAAKARSNVKHLLSLKVITQAQAEAMLARIK